jgi:hypothetical protein
MELVLLLKVEQQVVLEWVQLEVALFLLVL